MPEPRPPSPLDTLAIASPCPARWEEMTGDDRQRFCALCQLTVYNLAGMTRDEAEALVAEKTAAGRLCVRLYRRADGTVLTKDCPVGVSALHRRRLRWLKNGGAAAAVALVTLAGVFIATEADAPRRPEGYIAGGIAPPPEMRLGEPARMGDVDQPVEPQTGESGPPTQPMPPVMGKLNYPTRHRPQPPRTTTRTASKPGCIQARFRVEYPRLSRSARTGGPRGIFYVLVLTGASGHGG